MIFYTVITVPQYDLLIYVIKEFYFRITMVVALRPESGSFPFDKQTGTVKMLSC